MFVPTSVSAAVSFIETLKTQFIFLLEFPVENLKHYARDMLLITSITALLFCLNQARLLFLYAAAVAVSQDLLDDTSNQICSTTPTDHSYRSMQAFDKCEETTEENGLKRVFLVENITCNDGSPAGFYIRKSKSSRKWIVHLEGGWYCYDESSCLKRWSRVRYLMSSLQWPPYRSGNGILSNDPAENPYWWNANHVFIPYCTSDIWSGRRIVPSDDGTFTFMGALIIKHVMKVLLRSGLRNGNTLILSGSSAGGVGVMLHLESIQKLLNRYDSKVKLKGIIDSAWFMDQTTVSPNLETTTSVEAVKKGFSFWKSQVPRSCRMTYPRELWKCFVGHKIYSTLPVPLFVFQWLFDEVQLHAENLATPITRPQWEHIHQMGNVLRNSLQNVTSIFAPSCISHTILTKKDWKSIKIDNISLPQSLRCWERQTSRSKHNKTNQYGSGVGMEAILLPSISKFGNASRNNHFPVSRQRKRRQRNKKAVANCKTLTKDCKRRHGYNADNVCSHRLIERCTWPQCNNYCPKLQNPVTGEDLDFLELLQSFGLDMTNVATALGVDIHTLNNMSRNELINLLTQQSN